MIKIDKLLQVKESEIISIHAEECENVGGYSITLTLTNGQEFHEHKINEEEAEKYIDGIADKIKKAEWMTLKIGDIEL